MRHDEGARVLPGGSRGDRARPPRGLLGTGPELRPVAASDRARERRGRWAGRPGWRTERDRARAAERDADAYPWRRAVGLDTADHAGRLDTAGHAVRLDDDGHGR
ncbi:hypothetical protein [Georgenia subflava]|uniref:hypothetical protein n=1 Tax=Georgenia subflava TaxID=1622177 RepID=UPI001D0DC1DD|nr:hypothetical protein [Georgenia subflava]